MTITDEMVEAGERAHSLAMQTGRPLVRAALEAAAPLIRAAVIEECAKRIEVAPYINVKADQTMMEGIADAIRAIAE